MDEHVAKLKEIHEKNGINVIRGSLIEELPEQLMSCVGYAAPQKRREST